MVKENPRIIVRRERRKRRMEKKKKKKTNPETQNNEPQLNTNSSSSPSPPPRPLLLNHLKRHSPSPSSSPPPPPPCPSPSPPLSPPKFSLSSPEPISKKRLSSVSRSFSDPKSPELRRALLRNPVLLGQLPPLPPPPPPSPQILRRAVSDPAPLRLPVSDSQGVRKFKNLGQMHQVFEEIPSENDRGCASKPTPNYSPTCYTRDDKGGERKMMRERTVGAERMEGDWTMIKINCPCGSDYHLLISEVEKKCYFKLV